MAVTTIIDIDVYNRPINAIVVDQLITVPLKNRIIWRFRFHEFSISGRFDHFESKIYFDGQSPFSWQENLSVLNVPPGLPMGEISLEGGYPQQPGEYKYGIKVTEESPDGFEYDEDPFLVILPF